MKKTLLATTFLVAGTVGLIAQGIVTFDNQPYNFENSIEMGGTVDYKIYESGTESGGVITGTPVTGKPTWRAYIFQAGAAVGAGLPFGDPGVVNTANDPTSGNRTLTTAAGAATTLEVRVFDGDIATGGKLLGASAPFPYTAPSSPTAQPSDFFIANFRGFVVPEPSTVALGVLGLGALLLFRRSK